MSKLPRGGRDGGRRGGRGGDANFLRGKNKSQSARPTFEFPENIPRANFDLRFAPAKISSLASVMVRLGERVKLGKLLRSI